MYHVTTAEVGNIFCPLVRSFKSFITRTLWETVRAIYMPSRKSSWLTARPFMEHTMSDGVSFWTRQV